MASMVQIAGYAYQAGLRNPAKISMAVAIAWAESGGNPAAFNPKGRDRSYGLWQINMKAHTTTELGIGSEDALYDPVVNARAMVKISNSGANWRPWSTYPLRAAAFLPAATTATGVFLANPSTAADYAQGVAGDVAGATGIDSLAQTISDAAQTPARILNWLTDGRTWLRIALFTIGGTLVVTGLYLFAKPAVDRTVETAAGVAAKVAKKGA